MYTTYVNVIRKGRCVKSQHYEQEAIIPSDKIKIDKTGPK